MGDPNLADDTAVDNQDVNPDVNQDTSVNQDGVDESDQGVADEQDLADKPDENELPPEEYADFETPEGVEVDKALLDKAIPVFKELGLTQVNAQKLIDLQVEHVQAFSQEQQSQFAEVVNGWANDAEADKEIGGEAFEQNIGIAKSAVEKFGTPELSQFLHDSGAGSHPEVIRMFVKIGKLTQEDQPGSGNPAAKDTDVVSRLYPNNKPRT
jgi:hypothetical protein